MSRGLWLALLIACAQAGSCANEPNETSSEQGTAEMGVLTLNLTGVDTLGRTHRLRGAEFVIRDESGWIYDGGVATNTVLSTESNPSAGILTVRVLPGWYSVALRGDWYIERLTSGGAERVQKVVLLSDASQYAYVYDNGTSEVRFRFGVDGDLLDFRSGDLNVNIDIERPEDGAQRGDAGSPLDAGSYLDAAPDGRI